MYRHTKKIQLVANQLQPLPLGEIRPLGWLLQQLRIQADGLSGHLDEFWPDVARSGWIGGDAEGWERGPYWLDGLVPLAFLLDDEGLQRKVHRWVDHILTHAHSDGWLGPVRDKQYGYEYDPWPRFPLLKALAQYHEVTGDGRVVPAMLQLIRKLDALLDERQLESWAHFRWADLLVSIYWLYERLPEAWLIELARKVGAQGFDWGAHFADFPYKRKTAPEEHNLLSHVVNNTMAIKAPGVWFRQSGNPSDLELAYRAMGVLDEYHGQATGVFSGDEHLAGTDPSQGTELCAVVEYMYSLETLLAVTGDPALADRLELIAYNALPATLDPAMWAHQYDQQVNQVLCSVSDQRAWTSNGPDSNLYGLEPNFGCCTANFHQGWPKLTSHLWMRTPDGGLAAVAYAPSSVTTQLGGSTVQVELRTDYPFSDRLEITVRTDEPARFPLHLRVPGWAHRAKVRIGHEPPVAAAAGTMHRIDNEWRGETTIKLHLPMEPRIVRRYHDAVSIYHGPLLYALEIGERWHHVRGEPPRADWEVHPTTPWNYALLIDGDDPGRSIRFQSGTLSSHPFSPAGAPVSATVVGKRVPGWTLVNDSAGPLPQSPVTSTVPLEELTLLPYGCTNLRIAEFPTLSR